MDDNPASGIPLDADEDPLPIPAPEPSPVSLADIRDVVIERLGEVLDQPDRPITTDPARASRDPESWVALATYGHPMLDAALAKHADGSSPAALVVLADGPAGPAVAYRADTVPP